MAAETPKRTRRKRSTIPGIGSDIASRDAGKDSMVTTTLESFYTTGKTIGTDHSYGGTINDDDRLFYSQREPVGKWWINNVGDDIWDNWFLVNDVDKPDDPKLDKAVQKVLIDLKARVQLPRETVFERRYGTAILLLAYTGFNTNWEDPLFKPNSDGSWPMLGISEKILQITPYPRTSISNYEEDTNPSSLRYGLPEYYIITNTSTDYNEYGTTTKKATIRVHWTRVIHDAPRLDEHPYLGESAIDPIFDDLVGGRNARWGMYQGYYRHGQGFPKIQTKGTKIENEAWVTAGGVNDMMNARGYFVCGEGEDISFVGTQGVALNPGSYFDTYFTFIAAATSVSQDTIKGVSAGRVSGSEVNERQYFKAISLQQRKKEPMLRELIDRFIQSGQIDFDGEYFIEWIDPFMVNPQDKASIEYLQERTNALRLQSEQIDEVRARKGMKPLPDKQGEMLLPAPGQFGQASPSVAGVSNQNAPARTSEEPGSPEGNAPDVGGFIYEQEVRQEKKYNDI